MAQEKKTENVDTATTVSNLKSNEPKKDNDKNNNKNNAENKPSPPSNDPNTEKKEAKIDTNGGISGDEIVAIVEGFGDTNLKHIVQKTGKTIEESLKNSAKLFDLFAQGQKEEALTKRGIKCGLEEDIALGLALELMKKYPKQSNESEIEKDDIWVYVENTSGGKLMFKRKNFSDVELLSKIVTDQPWLVYASIRYLNDRMQGRLAKDLQGGEKYTVVFSREGYYEPWFLDSAQAESDSISGKSAEIVDSEPPSQPNNRNRERNKRKNRNQVEAKNDEDEHETLPWKQTVSVDTYLERKAKEKNTKGKNVKGKGKRKGKRTSQRMGSRNHAQEEKDQQQKELQHHHPGFLKVIGLIEKEDAGLKKNQKKDEKLLKDAYKSDAKEIVELIKQTDPCELYEDFLRARFKDCRYVCLITGEKDPTMAHIAPKNAGSFRRALACYSGDRQALWNDKKRFLTVHDMRNVLPLSKKYHNEYDGLRMGFFWDFAANGGKGEWILFVPGPMINNTPCLAYELTQDDNKMREISDRMNEYMTDNDIFKRAVTGQYIAMRKKWKLNTETESSYFGRGRELTQSLGADVSVNE